MTNVSSREVFISAALSEDAAAIASLLREADLPHGDFLPHLDRFLVARDGGGKVVGAVGAEVYAPEALLRSLVVAPAWRGRGVGQRLFAALESRGEAWNIRRWWLLTLTAEEFFRARGFQPVPRGSAPAAIAATGEFQGLCPSVAVCLVRAGRPS